MSDNEINSDRQHLSEENREKLRKVLRTKLAGELTIKNVDLERTLCLAGQNPSRTTIEKIRQRLEETYHTDEYFLDEIEWILAPFWEDLTDETIAQLLIDSFEVFDSEQRGFLLQEELLRVLTSLGEIPLKKKDLQMMFSMVKDAKKFNYREFVQKLCASKLKVKKARRKKKKKKKQANK